MRLKRRQVGVFIVVVLQQGSNVALVVDLYSLLLRCLRMRAGLKHKPVDGSEDQELSGERHLFDLALCAKMTVSISTSAD